RAERLRLGRDAFPALGHIDLKVVTAADVLAMVRSVKARGALDIISFSRRWGTQPQTAKAGLTPAGTSEKSPGTRRST
ncbi:phage integrase central domain-containing protein, partial [Sphingomonas sp. 8AM]|uniref:phage integrase central domain-containing protein n=1 Tax=Sphingomonas sp. 8AM TaxID=2653170 RepID=UPI003FA71CC4